jgi:hypothetical protein
MTLAGFVGLGLMGWRARQKGRRAHAQPQTKRRPKAPRPHYPKEHYVGGKDVNRDANCATNVNNPSR